MAEFVDQTGRPGPSTWQTGEYPEGRGRNLPDAQRPVLR